MACASHSFAHTRPVWATCTASGSETQKSPTKFVVIKPSEVCRLLRIGLQSNAPKFQKKLGSQPAAPCS
eukprot:1159527-Pelagomonas_calceolata.AAC.11